MERFQEWLPEYATTFRNISENVCSETLRAYQYLPPGNDKLNTCYHHIDCIVANLTETRKANMASASVLLGLMPSLVASLAPSIAEITLLSLDHPVLSLLTRRIRYRDLATGVCDTFDLVYRLLWFNRKYMVCGNLLVRPHCPKLGMFELVYADSMDFFTCSDPSGVGHPI
ncbi:hypothetical protein GGR54DRAFT_425042 [Hypoxylon sp. NC1633]|nr:hypothetical protein GGR54DRAFT_425042 [Hypoxylon sp. NC1633]